MMRRRWAVFLGVLVLLLAGGGALWWRYDRVPAQPPGTANANGRLEMTRLDIAVKYPGRVVALTFNEGDDVAAGAVLAQQDTAEVDAQIRAAQAQRDRAQATLSRAQADEAARRDGERLARLEWREASDLHGQELVSAVELDRRRLALAAQTDGVRAATGAVAEARAAIAEADAQLARLSVIREEATIRAPLAGRIEYKVAEKDAVLAAGGRIAALLDPLDLYLTVFFPMEVAGKLTVGDGARVVLDAFDGEALPAVVAYVSHDAQFTPKYVETSSEREKLVYRVKLRIPADVARAQAGRLKAGMTGQGYVRTDPAKPWPALAGPASATGAGK